MIKQIQGVFGLTWIWHQVNLHVSTVICLKQA